MENLQIVYVDSDDRERPTESHSDFTYAINIKQPVNRVALTFASIPKSYYSIKSGSNTFIVETNRTITIPPGNYSFSELAGITQTLLNTGGVNTYTVVGSTITAKYTFTSTGSTSLVFGSNVLHKLFGFDANSSNAVGPGTPLTSTYVVNLNQLSALYVVSDLVQSNTAGYQVLAVIPAVKDPDYSNITYVNQAPDKFFRLPTNTQKNVFRFTLYDLDDNIIDLNNSGSVNFEILLWFEGKQSVLLETLLRDELNKRINEYDGKAKEVLK